MALNRDALAMLEATSRTFFIPISRLPDGLQEAVGAAYLCMRALDEIEDHPSLDAARKVRLLRRVSLSFQAWTGFQRPPVDDFASLLAPYQSLLPEVSLRLGEWAACAPAFIASRIWDTLAATADRMAYWVARGWNIQTETDLNRYTYAVAGTIGILLCDIWAWFDGAQMDRTQALCFGRGLQAVNILRNRADDLARGVDFFPTGWSRDEMDAYARRNLAAADEVTLPPGPYGAFIRIPSLLAYATLDALARGESKLSRSDVLRLVQV
ncbi:MAG TPA: squalene/phytoene synthase family protein [Anaerolineae bacterium]